MTTATLDQAQPVKTYPWGGQIILEIPLNKKSANKFYARHGRNSDGVEFIEFSKFGPIPNVEGKTYSQKMRLFSPVQWVRIKHYVESELTKSIGWDLKDAERVFSDQQQQPQEPKEAEAPKGKGSRKK